MQDVFARIGLALSRLSSVSTCNDKAEVDRLAAELQAYEGTINELIDQRVQARIDAISGGYGGTLDGLTKRVEALESGVSAIADQVDPPAPAADPAPEAPAPEAPTATDAAPAEAPVAEAPAPPPTPAPVVPEDLPNKDAVAEAIAANGVEPPPVATTSRDDLNAALHDAQGTTPTTGADTGTATA